MDNDDQQSRGLNILVVDDNVDLAETTSLLLELEGHRTSIANNGLDAVGAATSEHYDAVLLDLNMPIMDGFQAAAALGQLWPAPVLIAHSACDDVLTRRRTAELGFSAHLTKPVAPEILRAVLSQVCRSGDSRTQTKLSAAQYPSGEPILRRSLRACIVPTMEDRGDDGSSVDRSAPASA